MKKITFLFALLFLWGNGGFAQTNADCLDCHDDPEFTMEKNGTEISINVNPGIFAKSAHKDVACVECHVGFDPDEAPHKDVITPVNCMPCHEASGQQFSHSGHARDLQCTACHGDVHTPEKSWRLSRQCINCHKEATGEWKISVHFTAKDGPDCIDCHTRHSTDSVTSSRCLSCHGDETFAEKNGSEKERKFVLSYRESIHAEDTECSDCHAGHAVFPVDSSASPVNRQNLARTCGECHDDVTGVYRASEHGKALAAGFEFAPGCADCHGEHRIYGITDSRSPVSRAREINVCLKCHLDNPEVQARMSHSIGFVAAYETSIHGRKFAEGDTSAAICSDCHGAHSAMRASESASKVNKFNIAATCGNCHEEITEKFNKSIHGKALAKGVEDAPTCTDCHGEHDIIEHELAKSPVAPRNVSQAVCGPCHNSVRLASKFGLPSRNYSAYLNSYHGLAVRSGAAEAANCASCHGVHNILPSSDPGSTINPANLAKTCGECHPGANQNFAIGKVHSSAKSGGEKILFWISRVYILVILIVIGGMLLHNMLDWLRKVKTNYQQRYAAKAQEEKLTSGDRIRFYERMTLNERIQHLVMLTTFFTLVITGFMLKFPDAGWVMTLRRFGGESLFRFRGLLHRMAAIGMVAVSLYHIYYIIFTKRGRGIARDMWFRRQDFKDMLQMLKFNLSFSRQRPQFGRFNYIEKSEYWALAWGTVIMTVTGFALWFENQSMALFSKLFIDACELIHYYEAWLAFLAILIWHIYYVIFNPDVYPMNFTWITGKVTEEEMEHEHPLELAQLKSAEEKPDSKMEETGITGEK